jgi:hypothetical protein
VSIKEVEGVWKIEVRLKSKSVLGIFKLIFKCDLLLEGSDEFVFVVTFERRVSSSRAA